MKKNTLDGFLRIKALKDKTTEKPIVYKISADNGEEEQTIEIKRLSEKQYYNLVEDVTEENPKARQIDIADKVLYMAIPELHKKEVQEAFGNPEDPESIVSLIFTAQDRLNMFKALGEVVTTTTIEEIKN